MRITVIKQTAKGLPNLVEDDYEGYENKEDIQAEIESIKHYFWHGNAYRALQLLQSLEYTLYDLVETFSKPTKAMKTLYKYVSELYTYIKNNANYICNYGERYRNGERISTVFVESTINQVVSKRFSKKQQIRWTKRGAHLLLQTRAKVLINEL